MKTFLPRMQSSPAPGQTCKYLQCQCQCTKGINLHGCAICVDGGDLEHLSSAGSTLVQPGMEAFQVFADRAGFQLELKK